MTRMTWYPVSGGRWAVAMQTGNMETLAGLFDTENAEPGAANNKLKAVTYFDAQLRYTPDYLDGFSFAAGVNNLFDKDPPGCITCGLNNYDPNAYDAPGRFFYLRLSYKH